MTYRSTDFLLALLLTALLAACSSTPAVPPAPEAVSDVTATPSSGMIVVAWQDNSDNETGFTVSRKDATPTTGLAGQAADDGFIDIATLDPDTVRYEDSDVRSGVSYRYAVTANGEGGSSAPTEPADTAPISIVDEAPVADAQSLSTAEDAPLTIILTGSVAEGATLSFEVVTGPEHGSLSGIAPDLVYTPEANYSGTDSFTFKVDDGNLDSAEAGITITVGGDNDAPTADGLTLSTIEDTALEVTLAGSDADGDKLAFEVVAGPEHGSLSGSEPNLVYTPDANFAGKDEFTYRANDGTVDSAEAAKVALTVTPVNDAPVAVAQSVATGKNITLDVVLTGSDVDGDELSFEIVSQPLNGDLSGTAPNLTYSPAIDYSGPDQFVFRASDGNGLSDTATVSISVLHGGAAPVADAQQLQVAEDAYLPITLTGTDPDDTAFVFEITRNPANGSLTGTGSERVYTPVANFVGSDSFEFTVSDGVTTSAPATVSIDVIAEADAPVFTSVPLKTVDEDAVYAYAVTTTDADGDPLEITYYQKPSWMTFVDHGDGTATLDSVAGRPDNDDVGTGHRVELLVNDGTGEATIQAFTLEVVNTNDAPYFTSTAGGHQLADGHEFDVTTTEETASASLSVFATDVDAGDTLSFAIGTQASNGTAEVVGSVGSAEVVYTPSANFAGDDSFVVTVTDAAGAEDALSVNVTVSNVNDAPVITTENTSVTMSEDGEPTSFALTLKASDADLGIDAAEALSWSIDAQAQNGTAAVDATTGVVSYLPVADFNGADTFSVQVSDAYAATDTITVNVTIEAVNDAPTIDTAATGDPIDAGTVQEDSAESQLITLTGSDIDGDTLYWYLASEFPSLEGAVPTGFETESVVRIDRATGVVHYAPAADLFGEDGFAVIVTDREVDPATYDPTNGTEALSTGVLVSVTVTNVDDLPVAIDDTFTTAEDTLLPGNVIDAANVDGESDHDVDGDPIVVVDSDLSTAGTNPVTNPAHGVLTLQTDGSFTYQPSENFYGEDSFTYAIRDDNSGENVIGQVVITVTAVNDAPVITQGDSIAVASTEDAGAQALGSLTATDTEGDTLSWSVTSAAANGVAAIDGQGSLSYTPDADFAGADSFVVTISDGPASDTITVTVTVENVNDAPILTDAEGTAYTEGATATIVTDEDVADSLQLGVRDVDSSETFRWAISSQAVSGTASIDAQGVATYVPAAEFHGTDAFEVTVVDRDPAAADELADTILVEVTVNAVNDAPVIDGGDTVQVTMSEGGDPTPFALDLAAGDVDTTDTLTWSLDQNALATHGTAAVDAETGAVNYAPTDADFFGSDAFTVVVSDGNDSDRIRVDVTIENVNDAPAITDDGSNVYADGVSASISTDEDQAAPLLLGAVDIDQDGFVWSIAAQPANGSATVGTDGTVRYEPAADFNGSDSFTVHVSDDSTAAPGVLSDTIGVTVTVAAVADAPAPTDDYGTVAFDTVLTSLDSGATSVLTNDSDADGESLTVPVFQQVSDLGAAVNVVYDGQFSYDPSGSNQLAECGVHHDAFTYTVQDTSGARTTATVHITVTTNCPPSDLVLSGGAVTQGAMGETLVGTFSTVDPSPNDSHSYALVSGVGSDDNALFHLHHNELITTGTFDSGGRASVTIRMRTTDSTGLWLEEVFIISVQ